MAGYPYPTFDQFKEGMSTAIDQAKDRNFSSDFWHGAYTVEGFALSMWKGQPGSDNSDLPDLMKASPRPNVSATPTHQENQQVKEWEGKEKERQQMLATSPAAIDVHNCDLDECIHLMESFTEGEGIPNSSAMSRPDDADDDDVDDDVNDDTVDVNDKTKSVPSTSAVKTAQQAKTSVKEVEKKEDNPQFMSRSKMVRQLSPKSLNLDKDGKAMNIGTYIFIFNLIRRLVELARSAA